MKHSTIILSIFALLVSILAGFYIVLNAIFSDVFQYSQHVILFCLTLGVYFILTGIFAWVQPHEWHRWIHIFSWPAIIFAAVFSLSEFSPRIILNGTYALIAVDGAALAVWAVSRWRKKKLSAQDFGAVTKRLKSMMPYLVMVTALGVAVSAFVI